MRNLARFTAGTLVLFLGGLASADTVVMPELAVGAPVMGGVLETQYGPAVVFDGTNFLYTWRDKRDRGREDIWGARVAPNGTLLDPGGFPISRRVASDKLGSYSTARGASNGASSLVVWATSRLGAEMIVGRFVSKNGGATGQEIVIASCTTSTCRKPAVAFDGTNYLVAYRDSGIKTVRVSPAGAVLDATPNAIPQFKDDIDGIACDGVTCLILRSTYNPNLTPQPYYALHIAKSGIAVDAAEFEFGTPCANNIFGLPLLAFDGTYYVAIANNKIHRMTPDGATLAPLTVTQTVNPLAIAYDGTNYHVIRGDQRHVVYDKNGAIVSGPTNTQNSLGISIGQVDDRADIACGAGRCAEAFMDHGGNSPDLITFDIFTQIITGAGATAAPDPIRVTTSAEPAQGLPSTTASKTQGLVVWQPDVGNRYSSETSSVRVTRISAAGVVLDPAGIAITPIGKAVNLTSDGTTRLPMPTVSAASDGTDFLVAGVDRVGGGRGDAIRVARVSAAGAVLDTPAVIASDTAVADRPLVLWDGASYGLFYASPGDASPAHYARVSPEGAVLDVPSLTLPRLPASVAFNGTAYLLVWAEPGQQASTVYGARMDKAGTFLDDQPIVVSAGTGDRTEPVASSDGKDFFVVWTDKRNSTSAIYGTRVTGAGSVLDATGVVIAQESFGSQANDNRAAITWAPGQSRYVVSYTRVPLAPSHEELWTVPVTASAVVGTKLVVPTDDLRGAARDLAPMNGKVLLSYNRFDVGPSQGVVRSKARLVDFDAPPLGADGGTDGGSSGVDGGMTSSSSSSGGSSSSASSGSAPGAGGGAPPADSCGCRAAGAPTREPTLAVELLGLALLVLRRRQRAG